MKERRLRLLALVIAIAMLATIPSAMAASMTAMGTIKYEDGTTFPHGCYCWMENVEEEYGSEPWDYISEILPPFFDYQVDGEYVTVSDHFHVWVDSPDGNWFGENTVMYSEAYNSEMGVILVDIIMYEQEQPTENFTKLLPVDWNLISLPLTPLDNSVSAVLSTVSHDAVKQYNATTKLFEIATTMDPGTGYFVHVTTASTWEYEGTSVDSTSSDLESGLNMIGVSNSTMDVGTAMGSADYRYVARWNADNQEYQVYNPNAPVSFHGFTEMTAGEGYFVSARP